MLLDLKDRIPFGKYKGVLIETIIKQDAQYLYWATENIPWFALTTKVQDLLPNKRDLLNPVIGHHGGIFCPCDECGQKYSDVDMGIDFSTFGDQ